MPRKKIQPKVTYKQVKKPDLSAIDAVFDYLFDKMLAERSKTAPLSQGLQGLFIVILPQAVQVRDLFGYTIGMP